MADEQKSFPKIYASNWWALRKKAMELPDGKFTADTIPEMLNIKKNSVQANVLPAMNQFDLLDNHGKLTERGAKWILDDEYKEVCTDIIESIYPVDLMDTIPDPLNNREDVKDWFSRKSNSGMASVQQMTATYLLLFKGDPFESEEEKTGKKPGPKKSKIVKKPILKDQVQVVVVDKPAEVRQPAPEKMPTAFEQKMVTAEKRPSVMEYKSKYADKKPHVYETKPKYGEPKPSYLEQKSQYQEQKSQYQESKPPVIEYKSRYGDSKPVINESRQGGDDSPARINIKPAINIDIQVNITDESTPEQIEKIFASIAKYLSAK